MVRGMTQDELVEELEQFRAELVRLDKAKATVDAYMYRAGRFVRWRRDARRASTSEGAVDADLVAYESHANAAHDNSVTSWTFIDGARRFVAFLNGDYPAGRHERSAPVAARESRAVPICPPPIDLRGVEAARKKYREIEPRDLFYRAAVDLVDRAWPGSTGPLSLGEALAVLLFTWNKAYYQFRPPDKDHIERLEHLVDRHLRIITTLRGVRLSSRTANAGDLAPLFEDFELLLGPVGAAKALHVLAPTLFPIWDRTIANAYRCALTSRGTNATKYLRFMELTAQQCDRLEASGDSPADLVKALDEWNYVNFTRKGG